MIITILASDIAALIGDNHFRPSFDEINKYANMNGCSIETPTLKACKIINDTPYLKNKVFNDIREVDSFTKQIKLDNIHDEKIVCNEIYNQFNVKIGKKNEQKGIKLYEAQFNKTVTNKNNKNYYINRNDYVIVGKIDGLIDDRIIEVKNRMRCFFKDLRIYEKTQIMIYMKMLNMSKCDLVEVFNGEIKITTIDFDENYYNLIIDRLDEAVNLINMLIASNKETKNTETQLLESY